MSKIKFDLTQDRKFETGVSECVLFPLGTDGEYENGVAWNGITNITESPEGAETTTLYADNIEYLNLVSAEKFTATVEAYTYPDEFAACDGSAAVAGTALKAFQQTRKKFGLVYKTKVGNADNADAGYKLHFIYGCTAAPSERSYATVNDSPEAISFSWSLSTTPVEAGEGLKPCAHFEIDSTDPKAATKMQAVLDAVYGSEEEDAKLPTPAEIVALLK